MTEKTAQNNYEKRLKSRERKNRVHIAINPVSSAEYIKRGKLKLSGQRKGSGRTRKVRSKKNTAELTLGSVI